MRTQLLEPGRLALPVLLCACALACACRGNRLEEPHLRADTSSLSQTTLVAGVDAPLAAGENRLWCASLPLAWNELKGVVGGDLQVEGAPDEAVLLNANTVRREDVQSGGLVARAGFLHEGVVAEIQRELAAVDGRDPALDAFAAASDELQLIAYARLAKALEFATAFEDLEGLPLTFVHAGGETPVDNFGLGGFDPSKRKHQKLAEQVAIHHYGGTDDFVVQLLAEDSDDLIVIARLASPPTLAAAWEHVRSRLTEEPDDLDPGDELRIPEIDVDLRQAFEGLAGRALDNPGFEGTYLLAVRQDLRLRLDEEGVVVRSKAFIGVASAVAAAPRRMICDGPFLLAACEAGASSPYLLAWIAHPELLISRAP